MGETCRCFVAGKRAIFVSNDYKPNDKAKKRPSACWRLTFQQRFVSLSPPEGSGGREYQRHDLLQISTTPEHWELADTYHTSPEHWELAATDQHHTKYRKQPFRLPVITNYVATPFKVAMKTRQTTWHQVVTSIARRCHANILPSTGQDDKTTTTLPPPTPVPPKEEEEEDIPFLISFFIVFNRLTVV